MKYKDLLSPEWATAIGAIVQAIAVVWAAHVAVRQLHLSRRVQLEQARPQVAVDLIGRPGTNIFDLEVRNTGRSAAYDVSANFDPPLRSALESSRPVSQLPPIADLSIWAHIPTLQPGGAHRVLFDQGPVRFESDRAKFPDRYDVTVTYHGVGSTSKAPYVDHYTIDFGLYWGLTYSEPAEVATRKVLERLAKSVERLGTMPGADGYVVVETAAQRSERLTRGYANRVKEDSPPGYL